jgi:hypothetical protein
VGNIGQLRLPLSLMLCSVRSIIRYRRAYFHTLTRPIAKFENQQHALGNAQGAGHAADYGNGP